MTKFHLLPPPGPIAAMRVARRSALQRTRSGVRPARRRSGQASLLWILLFTIASSLATLVFACATPYPALAALAAVQMDRRDGVLLMIAAWGVSQAVGFCLMGYPWDGATALTGFAIGTSAAVCMVVASLVVASLVDQPRRSTLVRLVIAYLAAFVTFKLAIAAWAPIMGHADAAFSGTVLLRQFVRYAAILAGLYAVYRALTAAGVPAPMRAVAA